MPLSMPRSLSVLSFSLLFAACTAYREAAVLPAATGSGIPVLLPADSTHPMGDSILTDNFMEELLQQYPQYFDSILGNRKAYNAQVIYTKIDRGANGIAALKHYHFNVNAANYFYPGATVALPISILTLQRLNELKATGIDKNTTMLTGKDYSGQTAVYNDPTTTNGKPTIGNYLKKILVGNEEDAADRLYELLGQQYINEQLQQKAYSAAQIIRRLQPGTSAEEDRHTNPVQFLAPGNKLLYRQPGQYNGKPYLQIKDSAGKAMYHEEKNILALQDLHDILISLVFPYKLTASRRFALADDDRNYLLKYMSQLPTETLHPPYSDDTANYYPAYSRYLLYGAARGALPTGMRIFHTSGQAAGSLLDIAYIVDFDKKIEFFLSAVIDCNSSQQANEANDYESIGLPFMQHLGQVIYEYESKREKKILPDLGEVKFEYDGR